MANVQVFEVGGCIRDAILGIPSKDVDLLVVGLTSFDKLVIFLLENDYRIFQKNEKFLNVRASHPTLGPVDIAMPRSESVESDGRRPNSVNLSDLYSDLSRRDFTINAIARDISSREIVDPFNGQEDLRNKLLRAVGNPEDRFQEDGLRAVRALRFCLTKELELDTDLLDALKKFNPESGLKAVSKDRLRDELSKMFRYSTLRSVLLLNQFPRLRDYLLSKVNLQPTLGAVKH